MPYLLLTIGILIVLVVNLLGHFKQKPIVFSDIVDSSMKESNSIHDKMIIRIEELENRLEEIEKSLLFLDKDFSIDNFEQDKSGKIVEVKNKSEVENIVYVKELEKNDDNKINERLLKKDEINDLIFRLSDAGKSVDEISSELRLGKGEVLLRLGLRK